MPAAIDASSLYYYYWGKNTSENTILPVTRVRLNSYSDDNHKGYVDVNLEAGTYELYLFAVESELTIGGTSATYGDDVSAVKNAAYFISSASVDIRYMESVTFYLTPASSSASYGTGSVNLELYTTWALPDSGLSIIVGLYDMITNQALSCWNPNTSNYESSEWNLVDNLQRPAPTGSPNYYLHYMTPGSYNFAVKFYTDGGKNCYVYSDILTVYSNQDTRAAIAIPPVIEALPDAAPSDFRAGWACSSDLENDFYYAEFAWNDNSTNESYFQLELMDLAKIDFSNETYYEHITKVMDSAASSSEKESAWEALITAGASITKCSPENYGDSDNTAFQHINGDGSLWGNNTSIVYSFLLEKRYLARICAMTSRGPSDYAYLDLSSSSSLPDSSKLGLSFNNFDSQASSLNLYKITYNYNGGKYSSAEDEAADSKISRYHYHSQLFSSASQPQIIYPLDYVYEGTKTASLVHPTAGLWQSWRTGSLYGEEIIFDASNQAFYSECRNISLFAYYGGSTVTPESFELNSTLFVFGGSSESPVSQITIVSSDSANDSFTVNRSDYPYLYFGIADSSSSPRYDASLSSLKVIKNYGLQESLQGYNGNIDIQYSLLFKLDISDITSFESGKYYYASLNLVKSDDKNNPITYTLIFYLE